MKRFVACVQHKGKATCAALQSTMFTFFFFWGGGKDLLSFFPFWLLLMPKTTTKCFITSKQNTINVGVHLADITPEENVTIIDKPANCMMGLKI